MGCRSCSVWNSEADSWYIDPCVKTKTLPMQFRLHRGRHECKIFIQIHCSRGAKNLYNFAIKREPLQMSVRDLFNIISLCCDAAPADLIPEAIGNICVWTVVVGGCGQAHECPKQWGFTRQALGADWYTVEALAAPRYCV